MIATIIDGINRFLTSLNIKQKYLNRAYTIISIIPIFYILRIVYNFYTHHEVLNAVLYIIVFIVFFYFWLLNLLYYFFQKNTHLDITQLLNHYLPDDLFDVTYREPGVTALDITSTKASERKLITDELNESNIKALRKCAYRYLQYNPTKKGDTLDFVSPELKVFLSEQAQVIIMLPSQHLIVGRFEEGQWNNNTLEKVLHVHCERKNGQWSNFTFTITEK